MPSRIPPLKGSPKNLDAGGVIGINFHVGFLRHDNRLEGCNTVSADRTPNWLCCPTHFNPVILSKSMFI